MIVFNLGCKSGHRFEGWFASADDFETQRGRALISCPVCGTNEVEKQLSAPRLNLSGAAEEPPQAQPSGSNVAVIDPAQRHFLEMVRRVIAESEDVGNRFAEEARKIHYKEAEVRGIYGEATADEAQALVEEGIEVHPLPRLPEDGN